MKVLSSFRRQPPWLSKLAGALGLSLVLASTPAVADTLTIKNIVLVHGALADGSSWSPVIAKLQAMGYHVTAVQNHLSSLADDVASTEQVLRRQPGNVLLVGHSWGGAVISQAGNASNVKGLAYLSALAPDSGESVADLLQRLDVHMAGPAPDGEGQIWLDEPKKFQEFMAADLPISKIRQLVAVQQPIAVRSLAEPVQHAAWHDKPSWYLRTENDRALLPAIQDAIARQMGAKVLSIRASHMAMVSRPAEVAAWIDRAAKEAAHHVAP